MLPEFTKELDVKDNQVPTSILVEESIPPEEFCEGFSILKKFGDEIILQDCAFYMINTK